jgi:hypothetical protein
MSEMPNIGPWIPWRDRQGIKGCDQPGVYLLGQLNGVPPKRVDAGAPEVIYVGETCDQNLSKRWYQFNRSAFRQKSGHSGGSTFAEKFCQNQIVVPFDWLYVAAHPVDMEEPRRSAHIRYVERWLLWLFVDRHGRLPHCNSK